MENSYNIPKKVIKDNSLSWKAKGMLLQLVAIHSDSFEKQDLLGMAKDKKSAMKSGFKELKDAGYIEYTRKGNEWKLKINI